MVPDFKHSLLSIKKLIDADHCKVIFYPEWCIIFHNESQEVKGLGRSKEGLYYLLNQNIKFVVGNMQHVANNSMKVSHGASRLKN